MSKVYKVLTNKEWVQFKELGEFLGTSLDINDGFIHLSTESQYLGVIQRYFQGIRPLYVVEFDALDFGDGLVFEPSTNGEKFPHLYKRPLRYLEVKGFTLIN